MKIGLAALAAAIFSIALIPACKSSQPAATATLPTGSQPCAQGILFTKYEGTVRMADDGALPRQYQAFRYSLHEAKGFFTKARNGDTVTLGIPLPEGCTAFRLYNSSTMSPDLAAKYPELASLKGNGVQDRGADARIDYSAKGLRGTIMTGGKHYMLGIAHTETADREAVLIVYDRADANRVKEPFEKVRPTQGATQRLDEVRPAR